MGSKGKEKNEPNKRSLLCRFTLLSVLLEYCESCFQSRGTMHWLPMKILLLYTCHLQSENSTAGELILSERLSDLPKGTKLVKENRNLKQPLALNPALFSLSQVLPLFPAWNTDPIQEKSLTFF